MSDNKHRLIIEDRAGIMLSGVTDVAGFDDCRIELTGSFGGLDILGEGLKIASLDLEEGKVSISGRIDAISYGESKEDKKARNKGKKALARLLK